MESLPVPSDLIPIFQGDHSQLLVWNPYHALYLRTRFRIIGCFSGLLAPSLPQKPGYLGLPLSLSLEEATLLIEKKCAFVVSEKIILPCEQELKEYEEIYQQKVKEYMAHKMQRSHEIQKSLENSKMEMMQQVPILIHTSAEALPWNQSYPPLEWNYPFNEQDLLRYQVFKNIWEKGFYITLGSKFGGDYLLYKDDPSLVHSSYIASIHSPDQKIPPLDLVSMGRLGTFVKKTHALCTWTQEEGFMVICIKWTGWN